MEKLTHKIHLKPLCLIILGLVMINLIGISLISADLYFDNVKEEIEFGDGISEYGKIEIRDWFGLQSLKTIELTENSEICPSTGCYAKKTITMYQDGALIDDIRFVALDSMYNQREDIADIGFYYKINDKWIEYNGEEVKGSGEGIDYEFELRGNLHPYQKVDWQIKTSGQWIDEWAVWTSSLNVDLIHYYNCSDPFDAINTSGVYNLTNNSATGRNSELNYDWFSPGLIGDAINVSNGNNAFINQSEMFNWANGNKTINLWIYPEATAINQIFLREENAQWFFSTDGSGDGTGIRYEGLYSATSENVSLGILSGGNWSMVSIVLESDGNYTIYLNGTGIVNNVITFGAGSSTTYLDLGRRAGGLYEGLIDEIGFWNRSLSAVEVTQLYNLGVGMTYEEFPGGFLINLTAPDDNEVFIDSSINFNASTINETAEPILGMNLTINDLVNYTITNSSDATTYLGFDTDVEFGFGDFNWSVTVWGNETNTTSVTRDFSRVRISEINITYNTTTYETATEDFIFDLNYLSSDYDSISAILNYNGTEYIGTKESSGNYVNFSKTLDIPLLDGDVAQDKSFYWTATLTDPLGTYYVNSSFSNQTVNPIYLGVCGGLANSTSLNFTAWDEAELTRINGFDFKANFEYYIGNGSTTKNTSINSLDIFNQTICINQNTTFYTDAVIEYEANFTGYNKRSYYLSNYGINNETEDIKLYLLNSSDSTSFILHVINHNQQDVEGAIIYTQRYYPGTGEYKTVQIAETDANGKTIGFFKTETVDYRFIIERNGETELITSKGKIIPEETPYTITFTIGVIITSPWADFDDLDDLEYSLTFNSSDNVTTFTYIDTSGNFTQGRLLVEEVRHNGTNIIICNTTSASSTATITCDASGYSGSFIAQAFITRTTEVTISLIVFLITSVVDIMGFEGLILGWFIILVAGCAFLWHPIAGVVGIESAIIFTNVIGLISFSPLFIFGSLAVSVILIFILKD